MTSKITIDALSDEKLLDLLSQTKLFSRLERSVCELILPLFDIVALKKGEVLFELGDASDSLFIVVEGQLVALLPPSGGKQQVIGTIEKGETVGELGALSNQPRSLTVHAANEVFLLRLTREAFQSFCEKYPGIIFPMIELIISRSQNTIRLLSRKKLYRHLLLINGDGSERYAHFLQRLRNQIQDQSDIIIVEKIEDKESLHHIFEEATRQKKTAIFVIDPDQTDHLDYIYHHINGVFVTVNGDKPSRLSTFAKHIVSSHIAHFIDQYELIVLHDDATDFPSNTKSWLDQAHFTLHHHLKISDDHGYKRIMRFMTGKAHGLVIGGGGVRGWAAIGAIKALEEANIPIDIIGGTSVGAMIGSFYALTQSYKKTLQAFQKLVELTQGLFSLKNFSWPLISLLNAKKPTEALHDLYGEHKIEDLWLPFFGVSCNLTQGKEVLHDQGMLWEAIRASASIPGIAPPLVVDGHLYVDGGLLNNLPVDCMRSWLGNEAFIMAISLTGGNEAEKKYNFPPIIPFRVGLLRKLKLGYQDYIFPPFVDTFLRSLLVGSSSKAQIHEGLADLLIKPDLNKFYFLNNNLKQSDKLITIGYDETQKKLEENALLKKEG